MAVLLEGDGDGGRGGRYAVRVTMNKGVRIASIRDEQIHHNGNDDGMCSFDEITFKFEILSVDKFGMVAIWTKIV